MFELIFFTSNRTKTLHAQYLCRHYNVKISNFREKTYHANYEEPRTQNRDRLLKESLKSAKEKAISAGLSIKQPFIFEDTSVIIHSLSSNGNEYPGTDIKFWMRETSFESIDFQLIFFGNNRAVTVRSDLVLYLPSVPPFEFYFTSKADGVIVDAENRDLKTNLIYPWLDNKTFNKWFCPEGEVKVISELPIESADKYDFRKNAFYEMLDFLYKEGIIFRRSLSEPERIIKSDSCLHIVVGLSCAGKTTIAEYMVDTKSFLHIEASDFMHLIYLETHGEKSDVKIGEFARQVLEKRPTLVAERVLEFLETYNWSNIVITGFRKNEEIDYIHDNYLTSGEIKIIKINASENVRKNRKIVRNRNESEMSTEDFHSRDERELSMGLTSIFSRNDLVEIENNESVDTYYKTYTKKCNLHSMKIKNPKKILINPEQQKLYDLVILTLYKLKSNGEKSPFFSTRGICDNVNSIFKLKKPKFRNNIGRLLNKKFDVFFEVQYDKNRKLKHYRLSNTGCGHAKLLLKKYHLP